MSSKLLSFLVVAVPIAMGLAALAMSVRQLRFMRRQTADNSRLTKLLSVSFHDFGPDDRTGIEGPHGLELHGRELGSALIVIVSLALLIAGTILGSGVIE
ncbi:MAG TPA: hypothetical protein VL460_03825 [Caulobacteraceae bacterium]|jgi:hypothetical protein|nr:hypothetical protein [Caulobacteraceae bacterium]